MAWKTLDIRNDDRSALPGSGAADAFTDRNPHARRFALERSQNKFVSLQEVKPGPIQVWKRVIDQCGSIGGVGDQVPLIREQARQLGAQFLVELSLVARGH